MLLFNGFRGSCQQDVWITLHFTMIQFLCSSIWKKKRDCDVYRSCIIRVSSDGSHQSLHSIQPHECFVIKLLGPPPKLRQDFIMSKASHQTTSIILERKNWPSLLLWNLKHSISLMAHCAVIKVVGMIY